MKLNIFSFIFILSIFNINSQNTIAIQSFENSGDTWLPLIFSTPPCSNNNDIWNYSTQLSGINPSHGSQFWGIQDLDGSCGGTGFETITFPNINVSSFTDIIFSFDYNARNFDNNEDLKYELFYDDVSQGEVIVVNGVRGRSDNTNGWNTETVSIPGSVTNVSVMLSAKCNRGNERAGFDNVKLTEASIDSCEGSEPLIVYANGASSGNEISADTSTATPSSMSNTSCDSYTSNENLDLFYTFTVPVGETSINVLTSGTNGNTINVAVWDSCNGNEIICQNNNSSQHQLSGLTSGTTYILQVWHDDFNAGPFNIALEIPPPPPTNDDCFNATTLTVGNANTQNVVTGTNENTSDSGVLPRPSCAFYNGNDVWFTAQVPPSGILTVETLNAGSNIDTGLAVYTGTCDNLTQVACDDDSGPGLYSTINLTGLPNTTVYIRVWAYGNRSTGSFNIVAYTPLCPNTTRWTGSSWNNGVPNSFTSAVINSDYDTTVNGSFESCNCQINNNRMVNIAANDYVTIHNDLTVNGTLEVRNEGSLVMTNNDAEILIAGVFQVHKATTPLNDRNDYTYWSSPVEGVDISTVFQPGTYHQSRLYFWDQSVANVIPGGGSEALGEWIPAAGLTMQPGRGYISQGPVLGTYPLQATVSFTGKPNNGIITLDENTIVYNADSNPNNDLNLIGNPYPSAIDADLFITDPNNTSMYGTLWFWTHGVVNNQNNSGEQYSSNDYASYNLTGGVAAVSGGEKPTGIIASGQGFITQAISNGSLTFNNEMRVNTGNDQFFRGTESKLVQEEKDRIWLNLYNDNGAFNQLLIGFIDGATDGIDQFFDGPNIGAGWISFYSLAEGKDLAIQGRQPLTNNEEIISLGFYTYVPEPSDLKIGINRIEGGLSDYEIYLKDKFLNIMHNLKVSDYGFEQIEVGSFNERFELIINKSMVLNTDDVSITTEDVILSYDRNQIKVKTTKGSIVSSVKAYDIIGKNIIEKTPHKSEFNIDTSNLNKGMVIIINLILENNQTLSKKIILY